MRDFYETFVRLSLHLGVVIYNQMVTWTAFAILAMFLVVGSMLSDKLYRRTRATGMPRTRTQRFYKARLVFQFTRRKSGIFEEEQQDKQHLKQDELVVFALFD